ncbi:MAG TPA: 4Fe-4S dicluster domain-containing protein [Phycisphaerae bacterium]|nr:4Fe-4S dicluster domain-containing protein [Phycisphaerae bacterium]
MGGSAVAVPAQQARAAHGPAVSEDVMGVLVDIPKCIGCRRCEYACQEAAGFNPPPVAQFEDKTPLEQARRPLPRSHTVINRYLNPKDPSKPLYNKFNCMHCNDPACLSACLVTAFSKRADGPVVYDASRCMGCRYCMVACPFEIPTYDYDMPLTPQVRKCNLCAHLVPEKQPAPACVTICPEEVMIYGPRKDLLEEAHERIRRAPDVYVDHVYGEHEGGGTSWLYLSNVPFEQVGFKYFDTQAPPRLPEKIQHAEFKGFVLPLAWYGLLGTIMWLTKPNPAERASEPEH